MGIRVIGKGRDVSATLHKEAERSTRALRRVHAAAAHAARDVAAEMAPFKTGLLEGSVEITESRDGDRRKVFMISASAVKAGYNYAPWTHEAEYNLGPGSIAKNQNGKHRVGRKYLTRALRWLMSDWGLYQKAAAAVKKR